METLDAFKTDRIQLLIASDVAARGLDIPAVSHVFNFDVPTHAEDYIHRIGRTGRAGRLGTSITLATPSDGKYLDAITRLIQRDIPAMKLEGNFAASDDSVQEERPRGEGEHKRGRRTRGGERGPRPERAPRETAAVQATPVPETPAPEARQPRPERGPRPERQPQAERTERPAPKQQQPRPERNRSDTPFGSDGPVPAFLLRR
jgi:superfamily II DNA/RNA helicase